MANAMQRVLALNIVLGHETTHLCGQAVQLHVQHMQ